MFPMVIKFTLFFCSSVFVVTYLFSLSVCSSFDYYYISFSVCFFILSRVSSVKKKIKSLCVKM